MMRQGNRNMKILALGVLCTLGLMHSVAADDIQDSIKEGLEYYNQGSYSEAVQSLNYAAQLISQKKGEGLKAYLPAPLSGWTLKESKSQAASAAMFGGGVTAEAEYTKGNSRVNVTMITDSPMLQSVMMMFSNPMFVTSDGGKLTKINGQKAIVKYKDENQRGEIQIVIANKILVTVEGRNVSLEDLKAYASAIDFNKLSSV